jgi:hypothetical protein
VIPAMFAGRVLLTVVDLADSFDSAVPPLQPSAQTHLNSDMDLIQFCASDARCAELEADESPNFGALTLFDLQREMIARKISCQGLNTKAQRVVALNDHFMRMQQELDARAPKRRCGQMLESKVQEQSGRKSFLHLPGEIRNVVYDLALFGDTQDEETRKWSFCSQAQKFKPTCSANRRDFEDATATFPPHPIPQAGTLSILAILTAMNKQLHQEVQTYFYSKITSDKTIYNKGWNIYYRVLCDFLEKIGPYGSSRLTTLIFPAAAHHFSHTDNSHFKSFLQLLSECENLHTLDIYMPVFAVIGPDDHVGLKAFLARGAKTLESSGINGLVKTLQSLF